MYEWQSFYSGVFEDTNILHSCLRSNYYVVTEFPGFQLCGAPLPSAMHDIHECGASQLLSPKNKPQLFNVKRMGNNGEDITL
jgi:hypothetical protein